MAFSVAAADLTSACGTYSIAVVQVSEVKIISAVATVKAKALDVPSFRRLSVIGTRSGAELMVAIDSTFKNGFLAL